MSMLTESPQTVKSKLEHFDRVYAEMIYHEVARAASYEYMRVVCKGVLRMTWEDFYAVFRQVWESYHEVDLSPFPVPPEPEIVNPGFEQWVQEMEAEFGDMSDAQIQQRTGVPMF